MDLEDKFLIKAPEVQSISSSAHSTPEKNSHLNHGSKNPDFCPENLNSAPKRELLRACYSLQNKNLGSFESKMIEHLRKTNKVARKQATKGSSGVNPLSASQQSSNKKPRRKLANPKQLREEPQDSKYPKKLQICENSACRKVLAKDEDFCKRCTCCICLKFDENKDPSNWLECKYQSESDECGLSCHVKCALAKHEVGVVYHGPSMQLDCAYRCPFCGTVSGILEFWKKQLVIAKHSRRLDTLSYKINLSCRLLDGTSKFKELYEIVKDAKGKLEGDIGPTDMDSSGTLHGLVGRLSVAEDIRNLCSLAIEKTDELLAQSSNASLVTSGRACNFVCNEVTFSSIRITVFGVFSAAVPDDLKGYKLWHHKTSKESRPKEPTHVIPTSLRTVTITNLEPCTEYTFCLAAYREAGDWGHTETNCVTKGVAELVKDDQSHMDAETESLSGKNLNNAMISASEHRVRGHGIFLSLAGTDKHGSSSKVNGKMEDMEEQAGNRFNNLGRHSSLSRHQVLDLNLMTVPDLNEDVAPPYDSSKDGEDNMNAMVACYGNGECNGRVPDTHGSNSTLSNKQISLSPPREEDPNGGIDENFESSIKMIRRLECDGHIGQAFRMKLLTWFCMRSTQFERRLLHILIQAFINDPDKLGEQLFDSFSDRVSAKRPKNRFSNEI